MPTAVGPLPATTITLTPDELDDLIYYSRTGDLDSLKEALNALHAAQGTTTTLSTILNSAIDVDADGLGSQASLLHYPAANGNLDVVTYLLSLLQPTSAGGVDQPKTASATQLVNHKNVSGNTPLHWAAVNGHLEVVKVLVQSGADPTLVNAAGRDAVVEAEFSAREGADKCAEWMLKNCDGLESVVAGGGAGDAEGADEEEGEEGQRPVNDKDDQSLQNGGSKNDDTQQDRAG